MAFDYEAVFPSAAQLETANRYLALIAEAQASGMSKISDWSTIETVVKYGLGPAFFPVGTQIEDTWHEAEDDAGYTVPWDVKHHYANGDMALAWHYLTPIIVFDAKEALFYAPEGGIAAGTYYISVGTSAGSGWETNQHINFTLNSDMDEGDQFVLVLDSLSQNPTSSRTWRVYAKGDTTVKDTGTTSDGTTGTELGSTSTESPYRTNGIINSPCRVASGYSRWSQSAIRQWLNSEAEAGQWWTPQNPWDRPTSSAATKRGFLAGCSEDFLNTIKPVPVVTLLNTAEDFEETTETTYDRIFIPSRSQIFASSTSTTEGEAWEYYIRLAAEIGRTTPFATDTAYDVLKAHPLTSPSSNSLWKLRTILQASCYINDTVTSSGSVTRSSSSTYVRAASDSVRYMPACIIRKPV